MKSELRTSNDGTENHSGAAQPQQNKEKSKSQKDLPDDCIAFYRMKSDEQLYQYLCDIAEQLGRPPTKAEVPGSHYIKARLGSWPRILEKAGIKPVSEKRCYKLERRIQTRKERSRKKAAGRAGREGSIQGKK